MSTRFFVTVHGGGEGTWVAEKAGDQIKQNALNNLRTVRLHHAYDYEGFNVTGILMQRGRRFDLARVEQWIDLEKGAAAVKDSRLVVTSEPINLGAETAFGLVIEVTAGDRFGWKPGCNGVNAVISIDEHQRAAKVAASIQDIFQDIMLANDDSVQAVLSKWRNAGGTDQVLYTKKAEFANTEVAAGRAGRLFAEFNADAYASFAAISRRNLYQTMGDVEREDFASLWTRFLEQEFCPHFLDVEEAVKLVLRGSFRNAKGELTAQGGERPDARTSHGMLSESEVRDTLQDDQLVRRSGSYILCFWLTAPGDSANRLGPLFGWRNAHQKSPRKLVLVNEESYRKFIPLVRDGLVTPIRLFLKKQ